MGEGAGERERERDGLPAGVSVLDFFVAFQNNAAHETGGLIFLVANLTGWKR